MANTHLGSFTNLPQLKGQIDPETGEKYIYTPNLPWWRDYEEEPVTHPEITMEKDRAIIETPKFGYAGSIEDLPKAREMMARDEELIAAGEKRKALEAPKRRPAIPDRKTFIKEMILPRLGGVDPYTVNVGQKAQQLYSKNRDKAFKQAFPDIPIGGMLTEEQQKHWQKVDEGIRQHYYNWVKNENDFQKNLYGHMMSEYEKQKAEIESKEKERKTLEAKAGELERFEEKERIKKRVGEEFEKPKEPTPVTWTTATKELKGRFGKQDPIGNIILTPELAGMHRIAQKKLVELKRAGISPLDAINKVEDFARNIESRYWQYIDAAKRNKQQIEKIKKLFKNKYKYLPRLRPR